MNYKYPEDNTHLFNNNSNSSSNNNTTLDLVQTKRSEYGTSNNNKNTTNNININDDYQDRDIEKKKKKNKKKPQRSSRFSLFGKRHQSDGYNSLSIQEEKRFEFGWRELYIQRQQKKKVDQTYPLNLIAYTYSSPLPLSVLPMLSCSL